MNLINVLLTAKSVKKAYTLLPVDVQDMIQKILKKF